LRRRTLVKLRAQVAPVAAPVYAEFLPRWHGLDSPRRGVHALRDAIVRLEGAALPLVELEQRVLPARVIDYHPHMLDELGATGELALIGAPDKRVILVRRDRARSLAPEPLPVAGAIAEAIAAHLAAAGASFLVAIEQAVGGPRAEVTAALWDLVWAGIVTNDTFAPLRSLHAPKGRRTAAHASMGGRWSLVSSLGAAPTATMRAHAHASALLERWGIASRAGARADDVPGGFAAVGDVLRAMEDAGTVRRGYFVESLEGAQFAWPAAVDRLREHAGSTSRSRAPRVDTLSALDPACAWGAALPWPALRDADARPARRAGASVIQVGGVFALWVEPRARRIATAADAPPETIELALALGIPLLAARTRRRELLVEAIDGEPAARSPYCRALTDARADYRGLVVRAAQIEHSSPIAASR
jgi:ATP-dependent Lhr-like helicase